MPPPALALDADPVLDVCEIELCEETALLVVDRVLVHELHAELGQRPLDEPLEPAPRQAAVGSFGEHRQQFARSASTSLPDARRDLAGPLRRQAGTQRAVQRLPGPFSTVDGDASHDRHRDADDPDPIDGHRVDGELPDERVRLRAGDTDADTAQDADVQLGVGGVAVQTVQPGSCPCDSAAAVVERSTATEARWCRVAGAPATATTPGPARSQSPLAIRLVCCLAVTPAARTCRSAAAPCWHRKIVANVGSIADPVDTEADGVAERPPGDG